MHVEAYAAGGRGAVAFEATRVVVYDAHGNPLFVAIEHAPGQTFLAHLDDPEFEELIEATGVLAARVVTRKTLA